jgi:hypothetical protein
MQPSSCTIQAESDDVIVMDSPEAVARLNAEIDRVQAHNRRVLRRLTPQGRRAFATYMRTGIRPVPIPARMAPRPRGAGRPADRRSAQRSSARSGDSGDSEGSEPPPHGRRLSGRAEINAWAAQRKAVLDALISAEGLGQRQLGFDDEKAAA